MTMRIYTSSDPSAPVLEGVVGGTLTGGAFATGSFLEALRQILVAGYGSQPGAGWTMPFTTTSRASFKQGAGCGFYLDVLDDGSLTAGAREAQMFGYEVMTAAATGTGQFPTTAQQATGIKFRKSDTADATQRPWICFADASTFYFFSIPQYPSGTLYYAGFAFGNFHTLITSPADAYNCIIIGRVTSAVLDTTTNECLDLLATGTSGNVVTTGHYVARNYTQTGSSTQVPVWMSLGGTGNNSNSPNMSVTGLFTNYPNPPDSSFMLSRVFVCDTTTPSTGLRGWLKGFYSSNQDATKIPLGINFQGVGTVSGKTFRLLGLRTGGSANGRFVMETSDTWDS